MISFIVPAYNEEHNVGATVQTIISAVTEIGTIDYEIILIDDGSTDGTHAAIVKLAEDHPSVVAIRNEQNSGLGSSVRRGINVASYPRFMVVPGDNDMSQSVIELLLTFQDRADLILTIPLNKESRSRLRNVVSMIYQMIQMVTFDVYLGYINGPGIWPTEKAKTIGLVANRFSIIAEMNVLLLRSGCTFAEVPGFFRAKIKTRRTITLVNLTEVIGLFLKLVYRVHVSSRSQFSSRPKRVQIEIGAKSNVAKAG